MSRTCLITMTTCMLCFGLLYDIKAFAADQTPCTKDVAKFCKDVPQNRRAINACLEEHESQLSDACKAYEAQIEKTRMESREAGTLQMRFRQACKDDMAKFCKDATPAQGGPVKCLKEHEKELSTPCNDSMKMMQEHKE